VNLGTPDDTSVPAVRRYLEEFLSDPRVIDISPLGRWLLLRLVILPRRPPESAHAYRRIWTERGSPLLFHGRDLAEKVGHALGDRFDVALAMRYGRPSVEEALLAYRARGVDRIVVLPLFPQYSSAAWGSAAEKVMAEAARLWNVPTLSFVPPFYDHPAFIDAFAAVARPVLEEARPDKVILSFHGVPERHCAKGDLSGGGHCLRSSGCCDAIVEANRFCYRAQCFSTARALAARLERGPDEVAIAFQSRLGKDPWIRPYTDEMVRDLARTGVKRLAVICPAFVADCLETLEEIGMRARDDFRARGGEELVLVPSLNSHDAWVRAVARIVREAVGEGA
jgi:ferrochelatase